MRAKYSRRYRHSKSPAGEAGRFKKQNRRDETFFAGPSQQTFFKTNTAIRRKNRQTEGDDTPLKRIQQIRQGEKVAKTKLKQNIASLFKKAGEAINFFTTYAEGVSSSLTYLNGSITGLALSILNALKASSGSVAAEAGLLPSFITGLLSTVNTASLLHSVPQDASLGKQLKVFLRNFQEAAISKFEGSGKDWQKQIDADDLVQKFKISSASEKVYALFERANPEDIKKISRWAGVPDPADFSLFNMLAENLVSQFNGWLQKELSYYERDNVSAVSGVVTDAAAQEGRPANNKEEDAENSSKEVKQDVGAEKDERRAAVSKKNTAKK